MRKLILKMSMSVDGFVGGSKSEVDWIFSSMDEGAVDWTMKAIWQAGVHIMGSRTFHDMASYWPFSNEVYAAPMNEIPKVVFSKNPSGDVAGRAVGVAQAAYEKALAYSQQRHAFGSPISSFQAVQLKLADLATEVQAARLLVWWAASRVGGRRADVETGMAKYFASEVALRSALTLDEDPWWLWLLRRVRGRAALP